MTIKTKLPSEIDLSPPTVGDFWVMREAKIGESVVQYGVQAPEEGGDVKLFSVRTPASKRGNGSARAAMEALIAAADSIGVNLKLDASALDRKTSTVRLVEFYRSLGFECTGRKANALGEPEMMRTYVPAKRASLRP